MILIPEIPYDLDVICEFVQSRMFRGRGFSIIACAEGAKSVGGEQVVARRIENSPDPIRLGGVGEQLTKQIEDKTGIETRSTVLGHTQRGGTPVAADRVLATQFGHYAMELLLAGNANRMVVMCEGRLDHVDILHAANKQRLVPADDPVITAARALKTCFGD